MEFGLHLPSAQTGANEDDILAVARAAERFGYDSVWFFDHLFTPAELASAYPYSGSGNYALSATDPFFDALALYGVLAAATERVRIGSDVMVAAYRHPIVLGKALASIERFAKGRLILGLAAGWMREEFEALGAPFGGRGRLLEEHVSALRAIWSGEVRAFEGKFYSWPAGGFGPVPSAPIPILLGGHSDAAIRRAARVGDGWVAATAPGQGAGLAGLAGRLAVLRDALERTGRDLDGFEVVYPHPLWFSDRPNDKLPLTGPPEAIAASLARLAELGVTHVDLTVFGPAAMIEEVAARFAQHVRPLLQG